MTITDLNEFIHSVSVMFRESVTSPGPGDRFLPEAFKLEPAWVCVKDRFSNRQGQTFNRVGLSRFLRNVYLDSDIAVEMNREFITGSCEADFKMLADMVDNYKVERAEEELGDVGEELACARDAFAEVERELSGRRRVRVRKGHAP